MIILRPIEPEDLDVLYEIENEMESWPCGHNNVPFSRMLLTEYIANQKADIYADGQVRLMIENGEEVVGIADIANFDPRDLRAEVSIIIRKEYRGRGYATEAIKKLVDYSHDIIMMEQIFAVVSESNEASIKLFLKCGFERTAILKSWLKTPSKRENACLFQLFLKKD